MSFVVVDARPLIHGLYLLGLIAVAATDLRWRSVFRVMSFIMITAVLMTAGLFFGEWEASTGGSVFGAGVFGLLYGIGRLLYGSREPLGSGDIVVAGLVGAMVGFPRVILALLMGVLLNGALGLCALLAGRGRASHIAYSPGLCLGGAIALLA
ncbi:MAG: hypothetical protein EXR58_02960 [Chloroflexi bacterium]|nr:hypothetical protein [Chloroflexota bacterium]